MKDKYLTIAQISRYLKYKMDHDENLTKVYLRGEISNFKHHTSGHLYFTLKDESARILAIMFKSSAATLNFVPQDGSKVLVTGRISVYEASGNYQIYVEEMEEDGIGNLYLQFEKLKKELESIGYFDPSHKKQIPKFPKRIGVITASTGAAVRDIFTTIKRRYPLVELILFPCLVQGENAKEDIVRNLKIADNSQLDVILLGRGGGSIEDLWAFNERIVADAIYQCNTPIISGVGHEIDFTISDFVADLRAPTPTAAAELAVPNQKDLQMLLLQYQERLKNNIIKQIKLKKEKLSQYQNSFILKNPSRMYEIKAQKVDHFVEKLELHMFRILDERKHTFLNAMQQLDSLNPARTILRGYAIIEKEKKIVTSIHDIQKDDQIKLNLKDGSLYAKVEKQIEKGEIYE